MIHNGFQFRPSSEDKRPVPSVETERMGLRNSKLT